MGPDLVFCLRSIPRIRSNRRRPLWQLPGAKLYRPFQGADPLVRLVQQFPQHFYRRRPARGKAGSTAAVNGPSAVRWIGPAVCCLDYPESRHVWLA